LIFLKNNFYWKLNIFHLLLQLADPLQHVAKQSPKNSKE